MNPIIAALIALLAVSDSLFASPYSDLKACGILGRELTVTQDLDPTLRKGPYYQVHRFEEPVCSEPPWLFLADQTLLRNLATLRQAGIHVILYYPTAFETNGKTFHSTAITFGPQSPTLRQVFPGLASNRPTLFISPETSLYDLNHEIQHILDFEKIFAAVTDSLLSLNLAEDEFEAAYRFIFELRAYAYQI